MSFITSSNFQARPYFIPNVEEQARDIVDLISKYEVETLKAIFGITLYNAFIAGLAVEPTEDKWTKLKDGDTYTYNGLVYEYKGLVSLLVPCIYYYWLKENRDKVTASGVVYNVPDKAEHVSGASRMVDAWNDFSNQVGQRRSQFGTMYGFMVNSDFTYDDWVFVCPGKTNEFGL